MGHFAHPRSGQRGRERLRFAHSRKSQVARRKIEARFLDCADRQSRKAGLKSKDVGPVRSASEAQFCDKGPRAAIRLCLLLSPVQVQYIRFKF
jgi:hypothetical protein